MVTAVRRRRGQGEYRYNLDYSQLGDRVRSWDSVVVSLTIAQGQEVSNGRVDAILMLVPNLELGIGIGMLQAMVSND